MNLYDLPKSYTLVLEDSYLPDDPSLENQLDAIRDDTATQMLTLGRAVKNLEATKLALRMEEDHLAAKREAIERRIVRLKAWMLSRMAGWGIDKAKDAVVTVWVQASPPRCEIVEEGLIPDEWKMASFIMPLPEVPENLRERAQVTVQKQAILKNLKATGELVEGVSIVRGQHVQVQ